MHTCCDVDFEGRKLPIKDSPTSHGVSDKRQRYVGDLQVLSVVLLVSPMEKILVTTGFSLVYFLHGLAIREALPP